ncbi:hypothetical protein ACLOJK_008919 [Asimina triloba]
MMLGLGLQVVENAADANFILTHGTEALGRSSGDAIPMKLEDLEQILEACARRKIPMVVANPDYVTVEARALRIMPGTLAAKYEKLGGEVKWMGKPDKVIYEAAMAMAGVDASSCIAVPLDLLKAVLSNLDYSSLPLYIYQQTVLCLPASQAKLFSTLCIARQIG